MELRFRRLRLRFRFRAGTSRGVLTERDAWLLQLSQQPNDVRVGMGECSPLKGLSIDDRNDWENVLRHYATLAGQASHYKDLLDQVPHDLPALRFGLETAGRDLEHGGNGVVYPGPFVEGKLQIPINGLIWMGDPDFMKQQIREKLDAGYRCLKMKIGAIDFETEYRILEGIRQHYGKEELILRVDANGAFGEHEVFRRLEALAQLDLHSIEQPVRAGQPELMQRVCRESPVPVALDEELIGVSDKKALLEHLRPPYIILKPTLLGGFAACDRWIEAAEAVGAGWWVTSALESNVGLNAICQYTASKGVTMHQGLGTGQLYENNVDSPLYLEGGTIGFDPEKNGEFRILNF